MRNGEIVIALRKIAQADGGGWTVERHGPNRGETVLIGHFLTRREGMIRAQAESVKYSARIIADGHYKPHVGRLS